MRVTLKIWTDAKSRVAAERVFERATQQLGWLPQNSRAEPYPKTGGYVWECEWELECPDWANCVVEVIALGQQLCNSWIVSGDVRQELIGWSTEARVAGIKAAQLTLQQQA